MLLEKNIQFRSMCEHHFVFFTGKCFIAYLPKERVMGLSKFSRIVQYCAKKPQLQERLTTDIVTMLEKKLGTTDIAVFIEAQHLCCTHRGVEDPDVTTVTSHLGGAFENQALRAEFMSIVTK